MEQDPRMAHNAPNRWTQAFGGALHDQPAVSVRPRSLRTWAATRTNGLTARLLARPVHRESFGSSHMGCASSKKSESMRQAEFRVEVALAHYEQKLARLEGHALAKRAQGQAKPRKSQEDEQQRATRSSEQELYHTLETVAAKAAAGGGKERRVSLGAAVPGARRNSATARTIRSTSPTLSPPSSGSSSPRCSRA